jgi:GNAT superfamily N-acetyltransferase
VTVEIVSAESGRAHAEFIELPYRLYRHDRFFVPHLRKEREAFFSKAHPFFEHADSAFFLARRDGRAVGRIEANVNHAHNTFYGDKTGFFGAFESEDDREASEALLSTAASWLRARGMTAMRGPATHSQNEEYGLLVDGFDAPPVAQMTYNPRYYATLLESFGLSKVKDFYAWWLPTSIEIDPRMRRVAEIAKRRKGVKVRPLRMQDYDTEVERALPLLNQALQHAWGFVPSTPRELSHVAEQFRSVLQPELVLFAEIEGALAGIALSIPDVNQALARVKNGRLWPFGLLQLLWGFRRVNQGRLVVLGVLAEYRKRGIDALLSLESLEAARRLGYRGGELSTTVEDNHLINRFIESIGALRYKTYRLYQKPLG